MPRVRQLTPELRTAERKASQTVRTKRIIEVAAKSRNMTLKDLSDRLGWKYNTLMSRLDSGSLRVSDMTMIADVLRFDDETMASCCGSRTRCRFEM